MLLYSPHKTPRLSYIIDFVNKELFNEPMVITTDKDEFIRYEHPKLNYSDNEFSEQEFFIKSTPLLFETGIRIQTIDSFELNYYKVFFSTIVNKKM